MKAKLTLFTLITAASFILTGCQHAVSEEIPEEELLVQTYQIQKSDIQKNLEVTGKIEPIQSVQIKSSLSEEVGEILVDIGDEVIKGEPLILLLGDAVLQNVKNAQTSLLNARQNTLIANLTANLTLQQAENNIKKAAESLEISKDTYETTLKTASSSMKETEEVYRKAILQTNISIEQAQDTFENTKNATDQQKKELMQAVEQTVRNAITEIEPQILFADTIVGVDNKTVNDIYEAHIGATDVLVTYTFDANYRKAWKALEELKESFHAEEPTSYIESAIQAANATRKLFNNINEALRNTFPSTDLPLEQLISLRNQSSAAEANMNRMIQSLQQVKDNLISTEISIKSQLDNAGANLKRAVEREGSHEETASILLAEAQFEKAKAQIEDQLEKARRSLEIAELDYANAEKAYEIAKRSNEATKLNAKSGEDGAAGQLALAMVQQEDLIVTAPFSGVITQKYVESGDKVSIGTPVLEVSDISDMKIVVNINAEDALHVQLGQSATAQDANAYVTKIAPSIDENTRKVRLELRSPDLKNVFAGSFVKVQMPLEGTQEKIAIPLSAVYISEAEKSVFVLQDGVIQKRVVEIGRILGSNVEITEGLEVGDAVITERGSHIQEGVQAKDAPQEESQEEIV